MNTDNLSNENENPILRIGSVSGSLFSSQFKKIPIIISKLNDNEIKGWRAEIADNYENYKTAKYEDINFEDLTFHFNHNTETHEKDNLVFYRRKDAVECAKYINKKFDNYEIKIIYNKRTYPFEFKIKMV